VIHTKTGVLLSAGALVALAAGDNVLMNRCDRYPTGANPNERILNASNVNVASFGKLYGYYVDGAVYAQPLYRDGVLYVATMNDKVYAFDASKPGPPRWVRDLTNELAGVTPVPVSDITHRNDLNIVGNVGILGTPAIDEERSAILLVARTKENGRYVERLHRLDLGSGKDQLPPATIEASVKSASKDAVNGELRFDPRAGNQRPALAIAKGKVWIAWASHEDIEPYHGWVMAYDIATLQQAGAFCVTPDGPEGGIWQSGRGPAVDAEGNVYYETGNGAWDGQRNFGMSVIKLAAGDGGLTVEDYFTPHDWAALNDRDADLGSTGPLLIPGTHLLLCGDKKGVLFLLDSRRLGKITPDDRGMLQTVEVNGGRDLAGPVYWDGPAGPTIYLWTETDFLKGFHFDGQALTAVPFAKGSAASHGSPGGALTVSSDGKKAGTGVVWGTVTTGKSADHGNAAGVLYAFDAESLKELWNSEAKPERDRLGTLVKFVPPTVANGRVYVPNYDNAVVVYGVL
jgi:outer membrane protein assembly factor BamB